MNKSILVKIKNIFKPIVYEFISKYNSSKGNNCRAVITGAEAINYYISPEIDTKDIDIKIIKNELLDWKKYKEFKNRERNPNDDAKKLSEIKTDYNIVKDGMSGFIKDLIIVLNNNKDNIIGSINNIDSSITKNNVSNIIISQIPISMDHSVKKLSNPYVLDTIDNNTNRLLIETLKDADLNILSGINIKLIFKNKQDVPRLIIIDIGIMSPYIFDIDIFEQDLYLFTNAKLRVNSTKTNYRSFEFGAVAKNFAYIEDKKKLCVVSISYLLYDLNRLMHKNFMLALYPESTTPEIKETYEKYAVRFGLIIDSLFEKLKCTDSFHDSCIKVCPDLQSA
jgi:hypothetical protein